MKTQDENAAPRCKKHGVEKIQAKDAREKLGYHWRCPACRTEYRQNNRERINECKRANVKLHRDTTLRWEEQNKDRRQGYRRKHYQRNRERLLAKTREYKRAKTAAVKELRKKAYHANPEKAKAAARQWRIENPERRRELARMFYEKNPERVRAWKKKWKDNNPEAVQAHQARRRAQKAKVVNTLTTTEWKEILRRFNYRCAYNGPNCKPKGPLTMDHVLPQSKGGGLTPHNIVPACQSCNSSKGTGAPPVPVQTLLIA